MPFAYYRQLNRRQQRIYRESDKVSAIVLPSPAPLRRTVLELAAALKQQQRQQVQSHAQGLFTGITASLEVPRTRVRVMAVRPSSEYEELHGYYHPAEGRRLATVTVWMRTAQRRQVVAFRSFLRTLLHELCHHLDYELLGLEDSFHTEGFYRRESSLFHQLVTGADQPRRTG